MNRYFVPRNLIDFLARCSHGTAGNMHQILKYKSFPVLELALLSLLRKNHRLNFKITLFKKLGTVVIAICWQNFFWVTSQTRQRLSILTITIWPSIKTMKRSRQKPVFLKSSFQVHVRIITEGSTQYNTSIYCNRSSVEHSQKRAELKIWSCKLKK